MEAARGFGGLISAAARASGGAASSGRDETRRLRSLGWERHDAGIRYLWPGAAWGARQGGRRGRRGLLTTVMSSTEMIMRWNTTWLTCGARPSASQRREESDHAVSACYWAGLLAGPRGKMKVSSCWAIVEGKTERAKTEGGRRILSFF